MFFILKLIKKDIFIMDTTDITQKRVAVIGTGPAGMSTLVAFKKAQTAGQAVP